MRIVVVEDEINAREGIVRLIGKLDGGYDVVGEADNGADGLAVIARTKPDLVITDIKMPGMSGLDMLAQLKADGHRHKMIILTGYSEFEYAQKALKMSVSDYLEKPITAPDLKEALAKVRAELLEMTLASAMPSKTESAESLWLRLLELEGEDAELQAAHIRTRLGFRDGAPLQVAVLFEGGEKDGAGARDPKPLIERAWADAGCASGTFAVPARGVWVSVVQSTDGTFDAAAVIDSRLFPEADKVGCELVVCLGETDRLSGLKGAVDDALKLAKWSMTLGRRQAIRQADVDRLPKRELPYPAALESACSRAIAAANGADVAKRFRCWTREFADAKYGPVQTIEYGIRFVSYMLRLAGELHGFALPEPLAGDWQSRLKASRTMRELTRTLDDVAAALAAVESPKDQPVYALLVQKAVRLVRERYAEGVTLEEIADRLRVSTAYLSGQFNREVGQPFSAYIKDLRLKKAKELLLGSELKTFEIARRVGYPDPKYFSRVFKEATGMTPGEYQKFNAR